MNDVRVAIVGLGPWGRNLLRAFSSVEGARVVAVCDENPARLPAELHGRDVSLLSTFGAVIADPAIDAVVIATPPRAHAAQCLAALDADKHVFVEKPMALRERDALRIEARARVSRRRFMVGHILRYHPALLRLLDIVRSGELGRIRGLHSARLGAGELTDSEGAWWALAPHDVSAMCALLGAAPTALSATLGPAANGQRAIRGVLSFAGGATGMVVAAAAADQKTRRLVVTGTRATAVFDDVEPIRKLRLHREPVDIVDSWTASADPDVPYEWIATSTTEPLVLEARHFVDAILGGAPIPTDAAEGRTVVAVLEAAERSLTLGGATVALAGQDFAARPEAPV